MSFLSLGYVLQQIVNGFILGSIYSLVAIGFSMIFSIIGLINFSHGDILMLGAFSALAFIAALHGSIWVVFGMVGIVGFLIGIVIERVAFRPIRSAPQVTGFITSLAVSSLIENLGILLLTAQPRSFNIPDYLNKLLSFGSVSFRMIDAIIVILSTVIVITLYLYTKHTRIGMAMRATAQNIDASKLMGINVNRVIMIAFAIGSALAAIAGLMWGAKFGQISPLMGFLPGLKAFVAAVIGGIRDIRGAVLGGYVLGFSEVLFVGLLPPDMSGYRDAFVFTLLIVILLIKPEGMLGREEEVIK